ncbi:unnamed protein product [Closterium sp. NIES-54]
MVRSDSILSFLPMPLAFSSPLSSPLPPPPPSPLPACIPSSSFQGAFRGRSPMGANVSHAAAAPSAPPPPPIAPAGVPPPPAGPVGLQQVVPPADAAGNVEKPQEKVDYLNLPCPVKYEEIQREALMSLKPDLFEGLRFDFNKPLNQSFSLSHSVLMGSAEVPSQSGGILKVPHSSYEFGANVLDAKASGA